MGYFADVMPTVAELAGASSHLPKQLDGLSFAPTLLGQADRQPKHEYLYWEAAGTKQDIVQQAVRWDNWKAVKNRGNDAFELYDLAKDIAEEHNVAEQHPEVLKKIDAICHEAHSPERVYGSGEAESAATYVR